MPAQQDGSEIAVGAPLTRLHIQIIACAGSGKTETMARRVAHLLAHNISPDSIVAFTFTDKAALELKQRILDRSEEQCGQKILGRIGRMYVGTIHAYALHLLQTYAPRYAGYELIEEAALRAWIARHCDAILGSRKWEGMWDRIDTFLRDADIIENEGLWPSGSDEFSGKYRKFIDTLESHRLLTFGRSITAAISELGRVTVRKNVQRDLRFVFVDEYQDVNSAQEILIKGLVGPSTQLCVVGDDDQSIYQWRGSNVAIMQGFRKRYRPVLRAKLQTNQRSVPSVVAVARDFAHTIRPRLDKEIGYLRKQSKHAHPVRILMPENRREEAAAIASAITEMRKSGWTLGHIAILIRWWRQAPPILEALEERGIPFDCGGGNSLFATELGYLLAAGFVLGIGWDVRYGWRQQSHLPPPPQSHQQWVRQIVAFLGLSGSQRKGVANWIKSFSKESQGKGTRPASLVGDLYALADAIGVKNWILSDEQHHLWLGTFARFSQVLASFERARLSGRWVNDGTGLAFRGAEDRGEWWYKALAFFLNDYALETIEGFAPMTDPGAPAVQVTTIHSAKGLQWAIVFLPGLEDGKFPSDKVGTPITTKISPKLVSRGILSRYASGEADERRLFYVGMTRARDLLVVSCPEKANKNRVASSVFFDFVRQHKQAYVPQKGIGGVPNPGKAKALRPPAPSLTFSELALYGDCPYAYQLATEFDVATPIARDLGYGKSIHHVLRRVAEIVKSSGKVPNKPELDKLFDSEFHVPFATAAGHKEMKGAARQLVARYINDWRSDLESVWEVERPFELHLGSVIVVGRADVILDRERQATPKLTIVDYKTYDSKEPKQSAEDQLRTYAAAGRKEGFHVDGAILHNLKSGSRHAVSIDATTIDGTLNRAIGWAADISKGRFPAKPDKDKCGSCDYRRICRYRM